MAEPVTLTVDGRDWGGWTGVEIARGIETAAGAFTLELTERWPGEPQRRAIATGAVCTLAVGETVVITGHVDDVSYGFDGASHRVTVRGRDRAGDLVDCSVVDDPKSWRDRTVAQIAADLARPFGVSVTAALATDPLREFTVQEGETAWEAIERACRLRGLLAISDGRGGLLLTRAGEERADAVLEQGRTLLSASADHSLRDRHSLYLVKGQQPGGDWLDGDEAAGPAGSADDPDVPRYRPLLILAEDQGDRATLRDRARWEAAIRAGRGQRARVTVQGWRQGGAVGPLWQPNSLVRLVSDWLAIDRELLIAAVTFRLADRSGTVTDLDLARPEAFLPEPLAASGGAGGGAGSGEGVARLGAPTRAARRHGAGEAAP